MHHFKTRHSMSCETVSGEGNSVDKVVVSNWISALPVVFSQYEPRNVFNADEAGLFVNLQPEESLGTKGETCRGKRKQGMNDCPLIQQDLFKVYLSGPSKTACAIRSSCYSKISMIRISQDRQKYSHHPKFVSSQKTR